jgi:hypothetical protein
MSEGGGHGHRHGGNGIVTFFVIFFLTLISCFRGK